MRKILGKVKNKILGRKPVDQRSARISQYIAGGRIPWSTGYYEYKWDFISHSLDDKTLLGVFQKHEPLPAGYGSGLDDRAVEYPWIFSRIRSGKSYFLDAGSTFNFPAIVNLPVVREKDLTILTFFPEPYAFNKQRVSYVYADLREMPLRDNWFDEIVCQSTLEHVGMDNSMYGYKDAPPDIGKGKDFSYLKVIHELVRVLKPGGQLLMTFPFGKFEFHGFFQQFDNEMLDSMLDEFGKTGRTETEFFLYTKDG
ncbi:MAG TPA: methyltransferase domain-containing protein, partial [Bacteroidia bacterium]|nr:methyltransferase domain-containing protein [Bacteroidia bacterium]